MIPVPLPLAFDNDDAMAAGESWNFNCGPGAVAGLFGLTPNQVLPWFQRAGFVAKGYTTPTMMRDVIRASGHSFISMLSPNVTWPIRGLARIQWHGPWMDEGVPIAARYRKTHWVASVGDFVFDINAIAQGGWCRREAWCEIIVPWILKTIPELKLADGKWSLTHALEFSVG